MRQVHKIGDSIYFTRIVREQDTAAFEGEQVHAVYATFCIARDAEWCSRQFVLLCKESHEEGIGTFVQVQHVGCALVGEAVLFKATIDELYKNVLNCSFTAYVGNRLIAEGRTGQKILDKEKLRKHFELLKNE